MSTKDALDLVNGKEKEHSKHRQWHEQNLGEKGKKLLVGRVSKKTIMARSISRVMDSYFQEPDG